MTGCQIIRNFFTLLQGAKVKWREFTGKYALNDLIQKLEKLETDKIKITLDKITLHPGQNNLH